MTSTAMVPVKTYPCQNAPSLDDIALALRELRNIHGSPSYTEIGARIVENRMAAGKTQQEAAVGRTTVYDCIKLGRTRMNPELIAEIVYAITADDELAEFWRQRCVDAQLARKNKMIFDMESGNVNADAATLASNNHVAPFFSAAASDQLAVSSVESPDADTAEVASELLPSVTPPLDLVAQPIAMADRLHLNVPRETSEVSHKSATTATAFGSRKSQRFIVVMLFLGILINVLPGYLISNTFGGYFPLFLDMIGTAAVAITLGPWWGALVAGLTSLVQVGPFGTITDNFPAIAFGLVAMSGALTWGYGVRRWKLGANLYRFVLLNIMVGLVCSIVAMPVLHLLFGGQMNNYIGQLMADNALAHGTAPGIAVFATNLIMSLADKMLVGLIAVTGLGVACPSYLPPGLAAFGRASLRELRQRAIFSATATGSSVSP